MKKILKSISIIFLLLIFTVPKAHAAYDPTEGKTFDVVMEVGEDGVVKVKTSATVNFVQSRQGIFVSLPMMYTGYNFSGFTGNAEDDNQTYYFPVENFKSSSHEYVLDNSSTKGKVYRLGTKGRYLDGEHTFKYSYEIHTKDLHLSTHQHLFFMNLIGDQWDFDFESINFEVRFDKSIEDSPVKFQLSDGTELTGATQNNHSISGYYEGSVGDRQALTILVELPDNYFTFKNLDSSVFAIGIGAIFLLIVSMWRNNIDQDRQIVDYIEWNPPQGFNSADVGYIHRGGVSLNKDVVSLIIYWADQGYLQLEEVDKKTTILHKVKDIDPSVKQYEKRLFNQLFKGRESVSTKTLENTFFQHINAANQNIGIYFRGENSLYDSKSQALAFMGSIIGFLILGFFAMILNYARFGMMRFMSLETGLFVGPAVVIALLGATVRGSELKQTKLWRIKKLIPLISSLILMGVIYDTSLRFHVNAFYMLIGSGLTLLGIYNATQATQYTENGNDWMSQILGMKDFIKSVELDQLELLVEEDPHLFYNVLPFAYVLDLSDRWIKKFETLTIPPSTWYVTPMHYHPRMYRNLNTTMSKLNSSMTSVPAAKGSSGGGFSSGGSSGGSFGGGGFGGGGGGSW